ncbi:uncharacterized protein NPIL_164111 [Nephila pilipes]|uniref:IRF tryptophan pentad repeat domain-containing protein n=1 Tax=Nephila pilipes TaxID=299642 RepID=A0A8X6N183_NEPPI|nr:uncharacterized protein NPIL_164111 [Nephila pilipes]
MDLLKKKSRRPSDTVTRSNVLKYIILCLIKGMHTHILHWFDMNSKVFEIKFVHKNNENWDGIYLNLFKELDKFSKKYEKYLESKDYECDCKTRCRANLRKLCETGLLSLIEEVTEKSIITKRYKINIEDFTLLNLNDFEKKMKKKFSKHNDINGDKTAFKIADINTAIQTENSFKEQSHYLCLSNPDDAALILSLESENMISSTNVTDINLNEFRKKGTFSMWNEKLHNITTEDSLDLLPNWCENFHKDVMKGDDDPLLSSAICPTDDVLVLNPDYSSEFQEYMQSNSLSAFMVADVY